MEVASSKIKKGYKQTEVGVIPEDWSFAFLSECGEIIMGQSPSGSSYNRKGIGSPLINGPTEFTEKYPVRIQWTTEPARFCKKGDLLICVRGSSTGRTNYSNDSYAIGRGVAAIRARGTNDTSYISYQVISSVSDILSKATGSTFPSVDAATFRKIVILLPDHKEQQVIATALSDTDELIQSLDALIEKKKNIKTATIQQLVTGKIRLSEFTAPWGNQRLGDLGKCLRGVTYKSETDLSLYDTKDTIRLLRSNNVQGSFVVTENLQYVDSARVAPQQILQKHDILICMANGSKELVGKAGIFFTDEQYEYTFGAFMGCFRAFAKTAHPGFLFLLFQTDLYRNYMKNLLAGSSINNLRPKDIESLIFSVPDFLEQKAIASVFSDIDSELLSLEKRRDKLISLKQGMMHELLTGNTRLV